jgi:hypothetical protein
MLGKKAMRKHLIVGALLIIEEIVIGSGFGQASFLVGAGLLIIYWADRHRTGVEASSF